MGTRKITIDDLRVEMFVVELDRPWIDTPFLFHRQKIKNQEQIDRLIKCGIREVVIDTEKGIDLDLDREPEKSDEAGYEPVKTGSVPPEVSEHQDIDPLKFDEELPQAKKITADVKCLMRDVFKDVRMGRDIKLSEVRQKVSDIVESVFRNRDALWCLAHLKDHDEYTFAHSVNVCILMVSFGRHLGIPRERLTGIAQGGILHDLGKTQIPEDILNKPGKYTENEFNVMKRHVTLGAKILRQYSDILQDALLVTLQHHERYDGTGYDQRLYGEEISLAGQIASIADVYDAMTSERVYRKAISPHLILKKLYEWGDTLFNRTLVERFIQCIGISPLVHL